MSAKMKRALRIILIELTTVCLVVGSRKMCNWSNEECEKAEDCCSENCHLAHEGTDKRCTRSTLSQFCVFDYHCRDGLSCDHYTCCSPYWENCVKDEDCCDPAQKCQATAGFIYRKCLYPSSGSQVSASVQTLFPLLSVTVTLLMNSMRL